MYRCFGTDHAYPFIWKELHANSYVSFHMEDWPQVSAFTYRLRGFSNMSAHHYMRAYQLSQWARVSQAYFAGKDDFCLGPIKRHKKALRLISDFLHTYGDNASSGRNYIAINHYIENSHDGNGRANFLDDDLLSFFEQLFAAGSLANTAVMLYSDHGSRFSKERAINPQAYYEERMPFFAVFLPDAYKRAHPLKYANLKRNAQQLTSPFDIYATLRDLACLGPPPPNAKLDPK